MLPIGGLKEKLLAAHRGGIRTVLIPSENEKDLTEMPKNVLKDLEIKPVQWIDQVLEVALVRIPEPREDSSSEESARATKPRTVKRRAAKKSGGLTKH